MAKSKAAPEAGPPRWIAPMLVQGWAGVAVWMAFGFLLESLLAYKTPAYLNDPQRRELFRLAHAHGTLLSLLLIVAAVCARLGLAVPPRAAAMSLRTGAILMPAGFFLAGVWHPEGDPGMAIWLVPPGALLLIFGIIATALASRNRSESNSGPRS